MQRPCGRGLLCQGKGGALNGWCAIDKRRRSGHRGGQDPHSVRLYRPVCASKILNLS